MRALAGRLGMRLGLHRWRALPVSRRRVILTPVLLGIGLLFPLVSGNAGNVDAAANAFTYVLLARPTPCSFTSPSGPCWR